MNERPDLRELVGEDVSATELELLRDADDAMRATPAPPEISESLSERVLAVRGERRSRRPWRLAAGVAVAAAIAGAAFGVGLWAGGGDGSEDFAVADVVSLQPAAASASQSWMRLSVLPRDDAGNWRMVADASGLPALPEGGYYELWLAKSGRLIVLCGRFRTPASGETDDVWFNAPYSFKYYDRWIVVAHVPGQRDARLLAGPVDVPD